MKDMATDKEIKEEQAQQPDNEQKSCECEQTQNVDCKQDKKKDRKAAKAAEKSADAKKIQELTDKLSKEHDDYLRLMAEFDNYRRRTSQEKLDLVSMAAVDTIKGLLPILDDFERALKVLGESGDSDAAKEGTQLIYTKLMSFLKGKGLAVIEAQGQPFDTDLHEAVAQFPVQEEEKKGKVFDVCQTGYTLNGKVIRFAKVVVGI